MHTYTFYFKDLSMDNLTEVICYYNKYFSEGSAGIPHETCEDGEKYNFEFTLTPTHIHWEKAITLAEKYNASITK